VKKRPKPKGLAALSAARRSEIAALGGASVPAERRNFTNPESARQAGLASGAARRKTSKDKKR
jgi:hypothetical protein